MLPWNLLKDSNSFTSYLSAYSVFLSSIAGVMVSPPSSSTTPQFLNPSQITEYYVIRRGHYRVADLYTASKDGWYYYTYGVNFRFVKLVLTRWQLLMHACRAYAAYISGILINVVGFAGASMCTTFYESIPHSTKLLSIAGRDVPIAATRVYQMSFFTGFGVSSLIYYVLNRIFPVPGMADKFAEIDLSNYNYIPGHGEPTHEHGRSSDEGSITSKKSDTKEEKFTVSSQPVV
jgi:nucleobase:cation symporter-1, NCS1 family